MHGSQMIYATLVSWPREQYNSALRALRVAPILAVLALATAAAQAPPAWRAAPDFLELFAPAGPRAAAYRVFTSDAGFDTVLRQLAADPSLARTPGGWTVQALAPADAFGLAGRYDRIALARLYGSARARVARGVRRERGAAEAWTLISPYPDPALRRLERGTLLLRMRYDRADPR